MISGLDRSGTIDGLARVCEEARGYDGSEAKGLLILACDSNGFTPDGVDAILKDIRVPVFGGIFPGIICGRERLERGTIAVGLPVRPTVTVIGGLSGKLEAAEHETAMEKVSLSGGVRTMFLLVDGLSKKIDPFIDGVFSVFGLQFNYIGAGAGSMSFKRRPCLFTNEGLIQDAALLVQLGLESRVAASHGLCALDGPFRVTESDGNVIKSINWRPALDVYREAVEEASELRFAGNGGFYEVARNFPLSIKKLGGEKVIRSPIRAGENGSIVCLGEVPTHSHVDILTSDAHSLIGAAERAFALVKNGHTERQNKGLTLFLSCASHALLLGGRFDEMLGRLVNEETKLVGALTLGEIANSRRDYLEFYNKTSVVGIFEWL